MSNNKNRSNVGFGNPPDAHKFKPGQSGNPGGRPKGSKSWKTVIEAELATEIGLKEQGVELKVTKMEAFAKRLVSDALAGNPKALGELLRQLNKYFGDVTPAEAKDLPASEADVRLLLKYAEKAIKTKVQNGGADDQANEF
ncbi:hypothetical protein RUE5091_00106 [Ruegeria denitrificans]|uniref:DUF5681 domain-containing protein n=1 Tax=Ruegeria denitrificans TaxID=1715692 RepID=A0A0P1I0U2_9RHOB|nr:DUF5681 domain-containing protein [Ruegeria denitrificans]CUJ83420.1 hypothetical protein RUE5091_00106 [Ruegeria denitrificans]